MKNLFAIPRLSLPETFTILITLVVCLVGFTNAEVYSNHRKRNPNQRENENFLIQKSSFRESVPYSHETSKISNGLQQKKIGSLRNLPESPLDKLFKRHSDYFGESEDADSEKESDGYGYDDDEYYHFNFKRNDDSGSKENIKSEKEDEASAKDALKNDKRFRDTHKETDKEVETIEMLNFKECHVGGTGGAKNSGTNTKSLADELHKKQFPESSSSLKVSDLRENSAVGEKIKDTKDSGGGSANNQKLVDSKTELKSDGKDSVKIKDVKLTEDSEKRQAESTLKDSKETVASKNLKEPSKSTEEKEKNVKLNENVKLEENVDKMDSKSKEPAKIVKDKEEISDYSEKINADELSEINSRANFASNDYKESADALKIAGADEEEKNSYEAGGVDKSSSLGECQGVKPSRERMRKQYKVRESYPGNRLESLNRQDTDSSEAFRDEGKRDSLLRRSSNYGTPNVNPKDIFKKSQFWKEMGLRDAKSRQQQSSLQQKAEPEQISQESQDVVGQMMSLGQSQNQPSQSSVFDSAIKNPFGLTLPRLDSEGGDYRKGYANSLKKLKGYSENVKALLPESSSTDSLTRSSHERLEDLIKESHEAESRRSMSPSVASEGKGRIQNKYSTNKRNVQDNAGSQSKKCQVQPREYEQFSSIKNSKGGSTLSDEQKQEEQQDSSRLRRKSPQKFEYEIKVINQNKDDNKGLAQLSHYALRRVEKDLKSKVAMDDKYPKKYPYSQASRDDLTRLNKVSESDSYIKIKRKAPIVKRHDQKSNIQARAAPSGYYGKRVKFGQKSLARNSERINGEPSRFEESDVMVPYFSAVDGIPAQRSREIKDDDFKHDPMKRFDESGTLNKGNSLLLVKKDERTSKSFEEGAAPSSSGENDYTSDALAKILAKDSDFLVLKRTDNNKFQKVSVKGQLPIVRFQSGNNQLTKDTSLGEDDDQKINPKEALIKKGLQTRSFHFDKEDKKFPTNLHSTSSKSNLKKTFEKFRDLAGFFKDNEQESPENPVREVKEGRDIVFSEDKLPDPIVISSDPGEKYSAFKTKPQNSIYSISTNFKALDQQEKKKELHNLEGHNMFASAGKADTSELSWEPALKSMFPEAKSINCTSRNGNEIIVLDLNRNQLRREHLLHPLVKQSGKQPYAPFGSTAQLPTSNNQFPPNNQFPSPTQFPFSSNQLFIPNNRKIQIVLEDGSIVQQDFPNARSEKSNKANDRKAYAVFAAPDNDGKIIVPSSETNNFSSLIKNIFDKKDSFKTVSKKSPDVNSEKKVSENYSKFLKDLGELSELREKGNKKQSISDRRNSNTGKITFSTLKQLSHGDDAIKYLGSLLQTLIPIDDHRLSDDKAEYFDRGKLRHPEDTSSTYSKEGPEGIIRRWSLGEEKSGDVPSIAEDEYVRKEEDLAGLQSEMSAPTNEKNSEDELWEELAAVSDKIHRLRREGKGKRKRKAGERALSLRERHQSSFQSALPDWKSEEGSQSGSESSFLDSKESEGARDENGNGSSWVAKLKDEETSAGSSDIKTRFETHLKELIEGLNENKNQKEQLLVPNESAWSRKKRKDTRRRKRSTWSDVKNKVSTTAVQNTILKNLAEDNYHSVYSPGIKRRLLSTDIQAEDADSYSDENERDKNVIAEEPQAKCVKNSLNECVDPVIIELLRDGAEEEKNRARRSLTSDLHSDFKREIDLDESMPNDFQNFLVTSLGAFGSQKREVVKKDEAVGEGKESYPDNYNRAVESGKEATEDSALEKREVPSDDDQKSYKKYYTSDSFPSPNLPPLIKVESEEEAQGQPNLKSKATEFVDQRRPTHIRIQITNARGKEKKSYKPIMEESETSSTEVEDLPKEKEIIDKSTLNSVQKNNFSKFRRFSPSKFSYNEFHDDGDDDQFNDMMQESYHPSKRRLKKKKFNSDAPLRPMNKLDRKAMESLPKRIVAEPGLMADHTTQKSAISNRLPQVETVYNPTQGTNKAQLESARLSKMNSIDNKNTETDRNNVDPAERSRFAEGTLRSYLDEKAEKLKSDKLKDLEERKSGRLQEKNSRLRSGHEVEFDNTPVGSSTDATSFFRSHRQKYYLQRHNPAPVGNYFFHPFPKETITPNNLYDALKQRQEMKNRNAANRDRQNSKSLQKTYHMSNPFKQDDKEKSQDVLSNSPARAEGVNSFEMTAGKKPLAQGQGSGGYPTPAVQAQGQGEDKSKMMLSKKHEGSEKNPVLESSLGLPLDDSKEQDYQDALEDVYEDEDKEGELSNDEQAVIDALKKPSKELDTPAYRRVYNYKPSNDGGVNEDDNENEEDYEENSEDDLDDYTMLAQKAKNTPRGKGRFRGAVQPNPLSGFGFPNLKDNIQEVKNKFPGPKMEDKFGSEAQLKEPKGGESKPLCKSSSLLKKANENGNIFGKNLMQNLYGLGYDEGVLGFDKVKKSETARIQNAMGASRLKKRKLISRSKEKRNRNRPQIGNRYFYAAKSEVGDSEVLIPPSHLENVKPHRSNNYRLTKEHFLDAEFAGPGNDYENESEEKGKYFNQINFAKKGFSQKASNERSADKEGNETEDVKENPEDQGETISEDNILENVIGKYIMRKTVKPSTDQASKRSTNKEKSRENRADWHKRRKRSGECPKRVPKAKVVRRRLSSGHLTENNFRKFHKKNLTRKRHVPEPESASQAADFPDQSPAKNENKRESEIQVKRSALDLLKKLTNKDRDKKAETPIDSRTAGFEPLSPLNDGKIQEPSNIKEGIANQDKKLTSGLVPEAPKSGLAEPKLPVMNVGYASKEPFADKKKNKATIKEGALQRVQGPWKIELNDKCEAQLSDQSLKNLKKGFNRLVDVKAPPSAEEPKGFKAFLVIGKSPKLVAVEEASSPASGSYLKEVGSSSYRHSFEEDTGISNKYFRKRYLKSSVDRMKGDYEEAAEKTPSELNERVQNERAEEASRALHETKSFAEGGSSRPAEEPQRNSKRSFVTADDQSKTSPLLSKGRLVKRKSAFPPSNDAKIIRDSRHVNEEISEYLGQQVVNAILSHVSANPRFKEMIAPGLAPRTPTYKQESFDKDNTLQQVDFSDQLQYFLQRFMYDLEKLAEKRVKKRMCNQIDKQAKQFLEFLLAGPTENGKGKNTKEDICPIPAILTTVNDDDGEQKIHFYDAPTPECTTESRTKATPPPECTPEYTTKPQMTECTPEFTPECTTEHRAKTTTTDYPPECTTEHRAKTTSATESSFRDLKAEIDALRKKCCLLLKLIVDYQNLSKLEKEILDSKYHNILQQLDRINQEIKSAKGAPEECMENKNPPNEELLCCGYKVEKNQQPKNFTHESESSLFRTTTESIRGSTNGRNKKPKQSQMKKLPKLYFEEMKNPAEPEVSTTTCIPVFENVSVGKLSELRKEAKGKPHSTFEVAPPTTLAPNSFDILLCSNSTMAPNNSKPIITTTCEPTTRKPIYKPISCQPISAAGGSKTMIMNSISAVNSGSNVYPHYVEQQADGKKRKKFAPHLPRRRKKRSNRKGESEFKKPEGSTKESEENYEEEYKGWSSVPAARRILNNLESGFEFDDLLFQKPKIMKKWRRGEKKPD